MNKINNKLRVLTGAYLNATDVNQMLVQLDKIRAICYSTLDALNKNGQLNPTLDNYFKILIQKADIALSPALDSLDYNSDPNRDPRVLHDLPENSIKH